MDHERRRGVHAAFGQTVVIRAERGMHGHREQVKIEIRAGGRIARGHIGLRPFS
jgi:hypothetical protein